MTGEEQNQAQISIKDSETAIKIAESAWLPIYGERIYSQRPYSVKNEGENWIVEGTLKPDMLGGTAMAIISKKDGKVLKISHSK